MTNTQSDAPASHAGGAALSRAAAPEQPAYLQGIDFEGLSTDNCIKYLNAHRWAHLSIAAAIQEIEKPESPHYAYWLDGGKKTAAFELRKAKVTAMLKAMVSDMGSEEGKNKFRYRYEAVPPTDKKGVPMPDAIAKSPGAGGIIIYDPGLTDDSLISRLKGTNDSPIVGDHAAEWMRTFVIAHEVAHGAGANAPELVETYNFKSCHGLAQDKPEESTNNAQNVALFIMACETPAPPYDNTEFNGIWHHGAGPDLKGASPAGVAAASIHDVMKNNSAWGAPAPRPVRCDLLMLVYQDADTNQRGALWFKVMLTRSVFNPSTVADWGQKWTGQRPMQFADGSNCRSYQDATWERPTPALMGLETGAGRYFRCAYVDMDTKRLRIVQSDVITDAMAAAEDFSALRWHAIAIEGLAPGLDACSARYGPAIAQLGDDFFCLYVNGDDKLKCLRQTGGGSFAEVSFGNSLDDKRPYQHFSSAPAITVLDNSLLCSIRLRSSGTEYSQRLVSYQGSYWQKARPWVMHTEVPVRSTSVWHSDAGPTFVLAAKSAEKASHTFFYWTCPVENGKPSEILGQRRCTMVNVRETPLLVAQGKTLHAFYQSENRDIRHLYAVDPHEPPFPIFPDEPAPSRSN